MKVPQLAHFSWYHKMQETKVPLRLKNKGTFFSECATAFLSRLVGHTLCLEQLYGCLFQPLYTCSAPGQVFVLCSWSIPRINVQFSQNPLASVEVEQEHTLCLEQLYAVNSGQFCDSARKQLGPIRLMWTLCSVTAQASCSDQQSECMLDQDWVLMQAKTDWVPMKEQGLCVRTYVDMRTMVRYCSWRITSFPLALSTFILV